MSLAVTRCLFAYLAHLKSPVVVKICIYVVSSQWDWCYHFCRGLSQRSTCSEEWKVQGVCRVLAGHACGCSEWILHPPHGGGVYACQDLLAYCKSCRGCYCRARLLRSNWWGDCLKVAARWVISCLSDHIELDMAGLLTPVCSCGSACHALARMQGHTHTHMQV